MFHKIILVTTIVIGIILSLFINLNFIYNVMIPDPCFYHKSEVETNDLFKLFFNLNSGTGFHPEPSIFNFCITVLIGGFIGYYGYKLLISHFKI